MLKYRVPHGSQKKLDGNAPAPASIRARARYAEYCALKGALSKANQAMTSDLTPSAAPTNINELRAKNPEPPTLTGTPSHNGLAYLAAKS